MKALPDVVRAALVRPEHQYQIRVDGYDVEPIAPEKWLRADLVREPENPVDQNAVQVSVDGVTVGYIDAEGAASLAAEVDAGIRWTAGIGVVIHPDHPDNPGLRVQLKRLDPLRQPVAPYPLYRKAAALQQGGVV